MPGEQIPDTSPGLTETNSLEILSRRSENKRPKDQRSFPNPAAPSEVFQRSALIRGRPLTLANCQLPHRFLALAIASSTASSALEAFNSARRSGVRSKFTP